MGDKNNKTPKDEPVENQNPINISKSIEKVEEEIEENASYNDTSSNGGGLFSPPLGRIKGQRRRWYVKGKGWTSVVIHPEPKVDEIKELIGDIQDKQEKNTCPLSKSCKGESSSPTQGKLQWIPKK